MLITIFWVCLAQLSSQGADLHICLLGSILAYCRTEFFIVSPYVSNKGFHFMVYYSWKCVLLIFHFPNERKRLGLSLPLFNLYLLTSKCKPYGKLSLAQYGKYSIKPNLPSLRSIISYNVHVVPRLWPLMSQQKPITRSIIPSNAQVPYYCFTTYDVWCLRLNQIYLYNVLYPDCPRKVHSLLWLNFLSSCSSRFLTNYRAKVMFNKFKYIDLDPEFDLWPTERCFHYYFIFLLFFFHIIGLQFCQQGTFNKDLVVS